MQFEMEKQIAKKGTQPDINTVFEVKVNFVKCFFLLI